MKEENKSVKNFPNLRFPGFEGEWEIRYLGDFIDVISGIALKSDEIIEFEKGTPILRGINITEGFIRHNKEIDRFYPKTLNEKTEKFILKINDLVIGMDGSKVGKNVALIDEKNIGSILIQRVARIRALNSANINFIFQKIFSSEFIKYVDLVNTSSGIPHISLQQIKDFKTSFPLNILEQEKIASFLSLLDSRIQTQKKIIEDLRLLKKNITKKIFNQQIKFKNTNQEEFSNWELTSLENILIKYEEKSTYSNQYPILTSARTGIYFQKDYFDDNEVASKDNTGYNVVPKGYFTYRHMSDDTIFKFNINDICDKGIVSTLYPVFTTTGVNDYFLKEYLNEGQEFKNYALLQKQGGSRTYMYFNKLSKLMLYFPPIDEQNKIAEFLKILDNKINLENDLLTKYENQKKYLLQNLFV